MTNLLAREGALLQFQSSYHKQSISCSARGRHKQHVRHHAAAAAVGSEVNCVDSRSAAALAPIRLDPEIKAKHRRPAGWTAPGPQPYSNPSREPELVPQAYETLSYLTGNWRIFQLKNGHRWSMDDMMTAYIALQEAAAMQQAAAAVATPGGRCTATAGTNALGGPIHRTLDIGCGIGSVLLMVAWGLRRMHTEQQQQQQTEGFHITSLGVEAQTISYQLAQRSIRYNLGPQQEQQLVKVINQDLRDPLPLEDHDDHQDQHDPDRRLFDLITGTPPYIPQGSGGRSLRPQKEPCCLEVRGGIEDYCLAAAAALAAAGVFVSCMGLQGQPAQFKGRRTQMAAAAAGLVIVRQVTVITREGKPPLFAVYVMRKAAEVLQNRQYWHKQQGVLQERHQQEQQQIDDFFESQVLSGQLVDVEEVFVVQHADGRHSEAWHAAREAMGLPPSK